MLRNEKKKISGVAFTRVSLTLPSHQKKFLLSGLKSYLRFMKSVSQLNVRYASVNLHFDIFPTLIKCLKQVIFFFNIQRYLYQIPQIKENFRQILECPVHCLKTVNHLWEFFSKNLFKNYIK